MAAFFKNTMVDVSLPEGQGDVQPPVSRFVHLQPANPKVVYETFGVDADVNLLLFDDVEGEPYYREFGRVTFDGRTFAISLPPLGWNALPTDVGSHVAVALTEVKVTA